MNGDEILAINDEDVEFASREHVISLIRKSVNKIKLVVKQPTVRFSLKQSFHFINVKERIGEKHPNFNFRVFRIF